MKRILLALLILFVGVTAKSQIYQGITGYGFKWNRIKPDSVLHLPSDTDTLLRTSYTTTPQIKSIAGKPWYFDGTRWYQINTSADSILTNYYTKAAADARFVHYTDTASMLSGYQRSGVLSSLYIQNQNGSTLSTQTAKFKINDTLWTTGAGIVGGNLLVGTTSNSGGYRANFNGTIGVIPTTNGSVDGIVINSNIGASTDYGYGGITAAGSGYTVTAASDINLTTTGSISTINFKRSGSTLVSVGGSTYVHDVSGAARVQGTLTVSTGGAAITGNSTVTGTLSTSGLDTYTANLGSTFTTRTKIDKGYADSANALKLNISDTASMLAGLTLDRVLTNGNASGRSATFGAVTATSFSGAGTGLTGNASSLSVGFATQWNSQTFTNSSLSTSPNSVMAYDGSNWRPATAASIQAFVGLNTSNWVPASGTLTNRRIPFVNSSGQLKDTAGFSWDNGSLNVPGDYYTPTGDFITNASGKGFYGALFNIYDNSSGILGTIENSSSNGSGLTVAAGSGIYKYALRLAGYNGDSIANFNPTGAYLYKDVYQSGNYGYNGGYGFFTLSTTGNVGSFQNTNSGGTGVFIQGGTDRNKYSLKVSGYSSADSIANFSPLGAYFYKPINAGSNSLTAGAISGTTGTFSDRVLSSGSTTNAFSGTNNSATEAAIYVNNLNASGYGVYSAGGKNYFAGNVGIGTTTPASKLSVVGQSNSNVLEIDNQTAGSLILSYNRGTSTYKQLELIASDFKFTTATTTALTIASNQAATFASSVTCTGDIRGYRAISSSSTLNGDDYFVKVTATATITLPTAVGRAGQKYVITSVSGTTTIATTSSQLIYFGAGTYSPTLNGANPNIIELYSDGSSWIITNYASGA